MKQTATVVCLIVLIALVFAACTKPPCRCNFTPIDYLDIRIIDGQGRNLIFGPARRFSADSIGVLKNNYDLKVHNASVNRSPNDTAALRLNFYVPAEKSFVYYNPQTETDTLDVIWTTKTGRCCGGPETYQTIEAVRLNGGSLQAQGGTYVIVK